MLYWNFPIRSSEGWNMKSKTARRRTAVHSSQGSTPIRDRLFGASALGMVISIAFGVALVLAGTAVSLSLLDPTSAVEPVGYTALYTASLLLGVICPLLDRASPYLVCVLSSTGTVLVICIASLALPPALDSGIPHYVRALMLAGYVVLALIACTVSVKLNKATHRTPKRIKRRR